MAKPWLDFCSRADAIGTDDITEFANEILNKEAELAALREAVSEVADGDCYYSDECTPETMRVYRHGKCNICKLRDALGR